MKVKREKLLAALEAVSIGLSQKAIIQQSDCFVFQEGKLFTFNDEISCTIDSPLDDLEGAVKGDKLLELLRKMTSDELTVEIGDGELLVKGRGERAGVSMENEVGLEIEIVETPEKWKTLPKEFSEAVGVVSSGVGKDESQLQLVCIHIHPKWMESCDSFQIMHHPIKTGLTKSVLVRGDSMKAVCKMNVNKILATDNWIHFRNEIGLVTSVRIVLDEYPDLSELLEVEGVEVAFPKGLIEAVDKAELFASENFDGDHITIKLTENKIRLEGRGPSGWYAKQMKGTYDGDPLEFLIVGSVFAEILKRSKTCIINEGRMKVDGGTYTFVACTSIVE